MMQEWQRREAELLRKENAWYNELSPFMKMVDNNLYFCIFFVVSITVAFDLGVMIGMML